MQSTYDLIDRSLPVKFMASQSAGNVLMRGDGRQFGVQDFDLHNRSGNAAVMGMAGVLAPSVWVAGQWVEAQYAAGNPYTDNTDLAQAESGAFVLDTVGTNNNGFVIASAIPFNLISVHVSQASASGTVWSMYYSKASAGTGFSNNYTAITNAFVAPSFGATGERLIWFATPPDWVKTSPDSAIINRHGAGIPSNHYVLIVKSTTAPDTTAGEASHLVVGKSWYATEDIPDNGRLTIGFASGEMVLPGGIDILAAAISDVTNLQSRATVHVRLR